MIKNIPNLLTFSRVLFVPLFGIFYHYQNFGAALSIFLILIATDFLDGYLARFFGWNSDLGAKLDPVADKLFSLLCLLIIFLEDNLLGYYLILAFTKDLAQLSSFPILLLILKIQFGVKPNIWAKIATNLRYFVLFCFILLKWQNLEVLSYLFDLILFLSVIGELYILINYFWQLKNIISGKIEYFY